MAEHRNSLRFAIRGVSNLDLTDEEELHQFESDSVKAGLEFMKNFVLSLDRSTREKFEFYTLGEAPPIISEVPPTKQQEKVRITLDDIEKVTKVPTATDRKVEQLKELILEDYDFGDSINAIRKRYKLPQQKVRQCLVDNGRTIRQRGTVIKHG